MRQELVAATAPRNSVMRARNGERALLRREDGTGPGSSAARRSLGLRAATCAGRKPRAAAPSLQPAEGPGCTPTAAAAVQLRAAGTPRAPGSHGPAPRAAAIGTGARRGQPPFRPPSPPGGRRRLHPGVRGGRGPEPLPAGTRLGSEGRPRGAPPPPARSPRGRATPPSGRAGPRAGRGERSRAPPRGLARPHRHPPPRYRGEPGPPPPHLAAWAAAPGPAAGAGQRAAQSMGRVPRGPGGDRGGGGRRRAQGKH